MTTALIVACALVMAAVCAWIVRRDQRKTAELQAILHKPRVAAAVMAAASVRQNPDRAKQIEAAMAQAVRDTLASGVSLSDSNTIRAAMLAARERVLRGDQ
jgi:hypothetical protein